MKRVAWSPLLALAAVAGCGSDSATGGGRVQVFVEPEDSVSDGLTPGTGTENVRDGWAVRYSKFLVTIGNFRAARSSSNERLTEPRAYVVDLQNVPAGGLVAAEFPSVAAGRWDRFGFDMPNASASAVRAQGISQEDYDRMVRGRYSVYLEATLTNAAGRSCRPSMPTECAPRTSLTVRWGLSAGTSFDDCAPETGAAGFAVVAGGTAQIKPTIHGDHWFFTNITQGAEVTERRAQWIADADLNRDGETTLDELRMVRASDVFPASAYNLSGALAPVNTAFDYLDAQSRTLGDFQGDGECPTRRALP